MITTEDLYGLTTDELYNELSLTKELHQGICDGRIKLLKEHLLKVTKEDSIDPRINKINKAIEFWSYLRNEK